VLAYHPVDPVTGLFQKFGRLLSGVLCFLVRFITLVAGLPARLTTPSWLFPVPVRILVIKALSLGPSIF
jgi:hypothetical protein